MEVVLLWKSLKFFYLIAGLTLVQAFILHRDQAERWVFLTVKRRGEGKPIITSYDFDEGILPSLKVTKFEGASAEWLKFVASNKNIKNFTDESDIVTEP